MELPRIFKKVFPKESYNEHKLRKYFSELTKYVQLFMAHRIFESNKKLVNEQTALYLNHQNNYHALEKYHRDAIRKNEENKIKGLKSYKQKSDLLHQLYFHPSFDKFPDGAEMLKANMESIDRELTLKKLFIACEAMNVSHFFNEEFAPSLLTEVQELVESFCKGEHPVFKIFLNLSYLLQGNGDKKLFEATMLLATNKSLLLEYEEHASCISLLINHAAREHRKTDDIFYLKKIHALNAFGLYKKMFIHRKKINESTFTNISNTASMIGEYNFASNFISDYQQYLDEKIRQKTVALAQAYLLFHKQDYKTAYHKISNIPFISLRYKLVARTLIIQCLYEIQGEDPSFKQLLKRELVAFKRFIKKNKSWNETRKNQYLIFVQVVDKIINNPDKKSIIEWLLRKSETNQPIMAKDWLMNKINSL
ncbi:MAG: hypothetical protein AAFZ15_13715 [Bacteroidota bacterium]